MSLVYVNRKEKVFLKYKISYDVRLDPNNAMFCCSIAKY